MKGRCPTSGTVIPADFPREDPQHKTAKCPQCGRIVGLYPGSRWNNYQAAWRPHKQAVR